MNKIFQGDALEVLKTLPDESVDCVVTSPPYWALRDYGIEGQLGLEPTFQEYITKLCNIFDEVKRVLKKEGTCWVNIGDTYYGSLKGAGCNNSGKQGIDMSNYPVGAMHNTGELSEKSLCNIPARFSIEMQNRGWILRNEIIWYKPNCMPCSVKDRFTVDFEKVFFFVKNKKYWFETQREPHNPDSIKRACRARTSNKLKEGKFAISYTGENTSYEDMEERFNAGELRAVHKDGRNKRCVWEVTLHPFSGAHFATYPEKLIEPMIKAGCPEGGIVLDMFFGAGTTGLVALKQNKKFIGIELNPKYIKIAEERIKPFLQQTKVFEYDNH